jgi:uncharacterized protein (DUF1810 family)
MERYFKKLTLQHQRQILSDIQTNDMKQGHWMWWVFPQPYGSWNQIKVSSTTEMYAFQPGEALLFIQHFYRFYIQCLTSLLTKRHIHSFFSKVDQIKLMSHLKGFYYEINHSKYKKTYSFITDKIVKLYKKIKLE